MSTDAGLGTDDARLNKSYHALNDELRDARREIDVLRLTTDSVTSEWERKILSRSNSSETVHSGSTISTSTDRDPTSIALELEMSKLQLRESQDAQESAAKRLAEYINIVQAARERVAQAEHERHAMGLLVQGWKAREEAAESERARLARKLEDSEHDRILLANELNRLKDNRDGEIPSDGLDAYKSTRWSPLITTPLLGSFSTPSLPSLPSLSSSISSLSDPKELALNLNRSITLNIMDYPSPSVMQSARNQILSALAIPTTAPSDALEPFIIPPPFSLTEFLEGAPGPLGSGEYFVFNETTTFWCADVEEHGYFLAPLYKCITNPKMAIINRWYECDPVGLLRQPTHCFYNKGEKWYYAGTYVGLPLANITPREWDGLAKDAKSALLKETLAGRRNLSPQVIYEAGQLHSVGALKIACIGLQCVGFDTGIYYRILGQAKKASTTGAWKGGWEL